MTSTESPTDYLLFWFSGGLEGQFLVKAATLDAAKRRMNAEGYGYTDCGQVGPQDGRAPGQWYMLDEL